MSVKGKIKRCNKRIAELEREVENLKEEKMELAYWGFSRKEKETQEYKENLIKLILSQRMGYTDDCCRFKISEGQLNTMKNVRLTVERDFFTPDGINFELDFRSREE